MGHDAELERIVAAYRERDRDPGDSALRGAGEPAFVQHREELERQILAALRAAGVELPRTALLDLGAGDGAILHRLSELGLRRAVGVELVPERHALARERHPALDVRLGSATELGFADGEFDVVTQFTVLSSVLDAGTRRAIAAEAMRVLRPGGIVLSYDLRRAPAVLRAARRVVAGASRDALTETRPLVRADLEALWGPAERVRTIQLNLDLAELVGGRRAVVAGLRAFPPLRSHLLATFRRR